MPNEVFLIFPILFLAIVVFFVTQRSRGRRLEEHGDKGYQLLHQAIKKAQAIVGQAELEEIKIVSSSKVKTQKFEQEITKDLTQTAQLYTKYLEDLKKASTIAQDNTLEAIKQQASELFLKFEQKLSEFLAQTEQRSTQSIDLELQATRQLIDSYKQQQLKIIDENIVAMLEKTLSLVLPQKISLQDQVEMIYDALEKAKQEKFMI